MSWNKPPAPRSAPPELRDTFAELVARAWPPDSEAPTEADWSHSLIASLPVGVLVTDAAGRCVYANPVFAHSAGISLSQARGFGWTRAVHPEDRAALSRAWELAASRGDPLRHEFRFAPTHARDRGEVWVATHATAQVDRAGRVLGYVGVVRDISERRRLEVERVELEARIRQSQRMEAVGTLADGIAHDFNNLLTAIVTGVQLALDERGLDAGVYECLRAAHESAERAGELTRQLLTLGRRRTLARRPTDLNERTYRAHELLERSLPGEVRVQLDLARDLPPVAVDPGALLHVVLNLAINAADAMPQGGCIHLHTSAASRPAARVGEPARTGVQLTVSDEGRGIAANDLARVFDPFFTTKMHGEGSGLGLAMAYGFAQSHSGEITAQSGDRGSAFCLWLPAQPGLQLDAPRSDGPLPCGDEVVLLVEDDRPVLFSAREVLFRCGYRVLTARDGEEALARHAGRAAEIDLLLTDLVMPRCGGRELLASLRQHGFRAPALLMTGYAAPGMEALAAEGFSDALLKPFDPTGLATAVRRELDAAAALA